MRKITLLRDNGGQAVIGIILVVALVVAATVLFSGDSKPPPGFVETMEPNWASVEIREGIEYDSAWASIVDLLVRDFDLEVLLKENGYLRTGWLYSWTRELREDYAVRVTVKFSPNRSKVEVKSEANYLKGKDWIIGSDTALLRTLKTDIMGMIGRITR